MIKLQTTMGFVLLAVGVSSVDNGGMIISTILTFAGALTLLLASKKI